MKLIKAPSATGTNQDLILAELEDTTYGLSALQALSADLGQLILSETGGTVTTDGTEQDIYINNAPAGIFNPCNLLLDFTNHTAGETIVVRVYYRIKSGGGLLKQNEITYAGVQDPLLINIELLPTRYGAEVTIQRTVGENRDYDYEVVYKI